MRIDEPMTMATDYVLATATAIFGVLLWRVAASNRSAPIRLWSLAFFFTSLGSLSGGSYHGFQRVFEPVIVAALWKVTVYAVGLGSFFLLTGAILAGTGDGSGMSSRAKRGIPSADMRRDPATGSLAEPALSERNESKGLGLTRTRSIVRSTLMALASLELIVYLGWVTRHDDFIYVIEDYGSSLIVIAILQIAAWVRSRVPSAPWVLGSIALSVVGAAIQASGFSLHRNFNHNDLYHVVQLVALWMLYRGGRVLDGRHPEERSDEGSYP